MKPGIRHLSILLLLLLPFAMRPAQAQDSPEAQLKQAWAAYEAGDNAKARALFAPLADRGEAEANYGLGLMEANGLGGPRDDAAAGGHFPTAAEGGHAVRQHTVEGAKA